MSPAGRILVGGILWGAGFGFLTGVLLCETRAYDPESFRPVYVWGFGLLLLIGGTRAATWGRKAELRRGLPWGLVAVIWLAGVIGTVAYCPWTISAGGSYHSPVYAWLWEPPSVFQPVGRPAPEVHVRVAYDRLAFLLGVWSLICAVFTVVAYWQRKGGSRNGPSQTATR